jgi:hypothetical protein
MGVSDVHGPLQANETSQTFECCAHPLFNGRGMISEISRGISAVISLFSR